MSINKNIFKLLNKPLYSTFCTSIRNTNYDNNNKNNNIDNSNTIIDNNTDNTNIITNTKNQVDFVTGFQPSGNLHIGNYLGVIRDTIKMINQNNTNIDNTNNNIQNNLNIDNTKHNTKNMGNIDNTKNNADMNNINNTQSTKNIGNIDNIDNIIQNNHKLIFLADLHALSDIYLNFQEKKIQKVNISAYCKEMTAMLLACGIDIQKSSIFIQSHNPLHTEIYQYIQCMIPHHWLQRMTQYKSKKQKGSTVGLYTYPILMASDILIYNAQRVPIGEDQIQHMELTRDIAERLNKEMKEEYFNIPKIMKYKNSKIMGIQNADKKMSKSTEQKDDIIYMLDDYPVIKSKLHKTYKKYQTVQKYQNIQKLQQQQQHQQDNINKYNRQQQYNNKNNNSNNNDKDIIYYDINSNNIQIDNLTNIYSAFTEIEKKEIIKRWQGKEMYKFVDELSEVIFEEMLKIQEKYYYIIKDIQYIDEILKKGQAEAMQCSIKQVQKIEEYYMRRK